MTEYDYEDATNMAGNRGRYYAEEAQVRISSDDFVESEPEETQVFQLKPEDIIQEEAPLEEPKVEPPKEQTVRVVIDQPKPKKKEKQRFEEGLTDEEKSEFKKVRMEEKRASLQERRLRLEQRKRRVEDAQFGEKINFPERVGAYRKARMITRAITPKPTQARARASARAWTPREAVAVVREKAPSNPVLRSQSKRANYFKQGGAHADYFGGGNFKRAAPVKPRNLAKAKASRLIHNLKIMGKQKARKGFKSRWKRLW